jgi:hypothetical protein
VDKIDIVSFGGGVQSTALAGMVLEGYLPRPALWIFADTGDEPRAVYSHVEKWREKIERAGMEFRIVHRTDPPQSLSDHVISRISEGLGGVHYPPLYVKREKRKGRMPLWRGCTKMFKSRVLDKHSKKFAEVPRAYKGPPMVRKWLGISYDEMSRMRTSQEKWFEFWYPLVEFKVTRSKCIEFLKKIGETAPRSACVYCPFHSDKEWARVKKDPEDWAKVVKFEKDFQKIWKEKGAFGGLRSMPTLHKSGLPIEEVDFSDAQNDLFNNWDQECAGICGV